MSACSKNLSTLLVAVVCVHAGTDVVTAKHQHGHHTTYRHAHTHHKRGNKVLPGLLSSSLSKFSDAEAKNATWCRTPGHLNKLGCFEGKLDFCDERTKADGSSCKELVTLAQMKHHFDTLEQGRLFLMQQNIDDCSCKGFDRVKDAEMKKKDEGEKQHKAPEWRFRKPRIVDVPENPTLDEIRQRLIERKDLLDGKANPAIDPSNKTFEMLEIKHRLANGKPVEHPLAKKVREGLERRYKKLRTGKENAKWEDDDEADKMNDVVVDLDAEEQKLFDKKNLEFCGENKFSNGVTCTAFTEHLFAKYKMVDFAAAKTMVMAGFSSDCACRDKKLRNPDYIDGFCGEQVTADGATCAEWARFVRLQGGLSTFALAQKEVLRSNAKDCRCDSKTAKNAEDQESLPYVVDLDGRFCGLKMLSNGSTCDAWAGMVQVEENLNSLTDAKARIADSTDACLCPKIAFEMKSKMLAKKAKAAKSEFDNL